MRYRLFVLTILIVLVGVWGAGCTGIETPAVPSDEPTMPSTPTVEPTVGLVPPEAQDVVALARADLVEMLDVDRKTIEVIAVEAVEWADTSLGCPQPGQMYVQVVTPGFRVVLEARGETHAYHTDRGRTVLLCEEEIVSRPTVPSPVESGLENSFNLPRRISLKGSPSVLSRSKSSKRNRWSGPMPAWAARGLERSLLRSSHLASVSW
jgi:hypothetical protein